MIGAMNGTFLVTSASSTVLNNLTSSVMDNSSSSVNANVTQVMNFYFLGIRACLGTLFTDSFLSPTPTLMAFTGVTNAHVGLHHVALRPLQDVTRPMARFKPRYFAWESGVDGYSSQIFRYLSV